MTDSRVVPQLVDESTWLALWEETGMGWSNGESIAQVDHPRYGWLTGIFCIGGVFVIADRYVDGRAPQTPARFLPDGELVGPIVLGDVRNSLILQTVRWSNFTVS